jgi:hypothetical protein
VVFEFLWFELGGLALNDMLRKIEHNLGDPHVLNIVEILILVPDLRVAQQVTHQSFAKWFDRNDVFSAGQHYTADRYHAHFADGLPNDCKSVMTDLASGTR